MIFIDGFGLGPGDPEVNPMVKAEMPFIRSLLSGEPLTREAVGEGLFRPGLVLRPVDATLDTPGLPQSATGQTVLFSGVNAPRIAGRHINGFPTKALRGILAEENVFKAAHRAGKRAIFANTFTPEYFEAVNRGKWRHSVTTTAALYGDCRFLMLPELIRGEAVFQDITNEALRERGYDVPLIEPETAAANLLRVAARNDFTLFEYFQTDRCGHKQDWDLALVLLNRLDRFLGSIATELRPNGINLLLVSDHGNIEDLTTKTHTPNPVPVISMGEGAECFSAVRSLMDVYPAIMDYLGISLESKV